MDWLDLLAVQGTLKSLLQHHNSKASIFWHSAFFIVQFSKITADGDCSHEIKIRLLLGRKVMTNLDSILKSRDIPLPTKVHLVKAMVFPIVMYGCESWNSRRAIQNPKGCCIQCVSKPGRPSRGHRTGKGQSSFQFPRRVVLRMF